VIEEDTRTEEKKTEEEKRVVELLRGLTLAVHEREILNILNACNSDTLNQILSHHVKWLLTDIDGDRLNTFFELLTRVRIEEITLETKKTILESLVIVGRTENLFIKTNSGNFYNCLSSMFHSLSEEELESLSADKKLEYELLARRGGLHLNPIPPTLWGTRSVFKEKKLRDNLAREDPRALPQKVYEAGCSALDALAVEVLKAFEGGGKGVRPADRPEFKELVALLGLEPLILTSPPPAWLDLDEYADLQVFVTACAMHAKKNTVLVAFVAAWEVCVRV
jgi:hypothetical protein